MDSPDQNSGNSEPIVSLPEINPSPAVKPKRPAKPLVEGINAPASKPAPAVTSNISLTGAEQKLINDPDLGKPISSLSKPEQVKILPEQWHPQGSSSWKKALVGLLVIVIVIVGVVGGYVWYLSRSVNDDVAVKNVPRTTTTKNLAPTTVPVVTPAPATTTTSTTATVVTPRVTIAATPTGYLNVRSTPSTAGALVTKVHPGETYPYTEIKNSWYHITLPDGSSGWVIGTYVTKVK